MLLIYLIGAILNAVILLLYSDFFVQSTQDAYSTNLILQQNTSVEKFLAITFIMICLLSWLFTLPIIISFIKGKLS